MIEYVIDTRTVNGDPKAYVHAVKNCLQDFWKNTEVKVTLVDHEVLHDVLSGFVPFGGRERAVRRFVESVSVERWYVK